MKKTFLLIFILAIVFGPSGNVLAAFYLSTQNDASLKTPPLTFQDDDILHYDPVANSASLIFNGSAHFSGNEDIDALHILEDGTMAIVISTVGGATLGGVQFEDGDLVRYSPVDKSASLYFEEDDHFHLTEDIDAFSIHPNGNLIISTDNDATLGLLDPLDFKEGDLVEYNPDTKTASIFFSETLFGEAMNIDAVHVDSNGNIILSTATAATLKDLDFDEDDLVRYNPTTGKASLLLDGNEEFTLQENIDAIYSSVPIPSAIWLLSSAFIGIVGLRRKFK